MNNTSTNFEGEHDRSFDELETKFSQGDVIKFIPLGVAPPPQNTKNWSMHLGVIVTANCDLAHHKHGGLLSYVPLVPVKELYQTNPKLIIISNHASHLDAVSIAAAIPRRFWLSL